jgi:hypothetical protein
MSTEPAHFQRLLELIPPEIMVKVWFFPLPSGKKYPPACKDPQDEKNRLTAQQALDRLKKGLNVGIYCLPGGLFIIDEDRENGAFIIPEEIRATFPNTLTIQTRNAGRQYYYQNNGKFNNKVYKYNGIKAGELRANWYYGVAPGSYVKPDDDAGQDATGLYSIINDALISQIEKIPAWMDVCEDIPKEEIKIEHKGTWKNDLGMPLYEIRKKSQKLDTLLNGANEGDRSASDMAAVQLLYFWRFADSEIAGILQEYRAYEKTARQDYLETTISKIIRGERYDPNYKGNGNGKEKTSQNAIKSTGAFDYIDRIVEKTPIYYDEAGQFWLWNREGFYRQVDNTEILLTLLIDIADPAIIQTKFKGELLEAARLRGRDARVKPVPTNWIHVQNGVYDIKTGELFEATPNYLFTDPIPHKIGDSEETPTIDKLFSEWVIPEKVKLLNEITAYCIYNGYPIHRMFILFGRGRNGKGQFRDFIVNLVGRQNRAVS